MTAVNIILTGASSASNLTWETINWGQVSKQVKRLQLRIAKAVREKRYGKTIPEAYYEPQFSKHSHGFRPKRGCHTALREVIQTGKGTKWFIEGDLCARFDKIDHSILLNILQESFHDNRFIRLLSGLLKAGYLEDWKFNRFCALISARV